MRFAALWTRLVPFDKVQENHDLIVEGGRV